MAITRAEFEAIEWSEILQGSDAAECFYYSCALLRAAEAASDRRRKEVLTSVAVITGLRLNPGDAVHPFASDGWPSIDNLDASDVAVFQELFPAIDDPELRARVSDVVWTRVRDYHAAQGAVAAYLESAARLEHPKNWRPYVDRVERAARLALSLRDERLLDLVFQDIEETLVKHNGSDPLYLSARLMDLLVEFHRGDADRYAALATKIATQAQQNQDWDRCRAYWDVAAAWHRRAERADEERLARLAAAEAYVLQSEALAARPNASYTMTAYHLQSAIVALRKIPGAQARVEEIHARLLEAQQRAVREMKPISVETDVSELVRASVAYAKGKSLLDALIALATVSQPPDINKLRERAIKERQQFPLQTLFESVILSAQGKITARTRCGGGLDPAGEDAGVRERMFRDAAMHHALSAQANIEPVRQMIVMEHPIRLGDFIPIVATSPFIPPGRERIFARGLLAGMTADYLAATSILMPQFENAIRYILGQRGVLTSGIDQAGIQEEFDLNKVLHSTPHYRALIESFGEDAVFDMRGLLVERLGSNLRNRVAHGLLDHDEFYSSPCCYFWWLTLRLTIVGWMVVSRSAQAD